MPKHINNQRKVIGARSDKNGNITQVLIEGNSNFTNINTAIKMAKANKLANVHSVHPKKSAPYLRTNRDSEKRNNLDEMAKN